MNLIHFVGNVAAKFWQNKNNRNLMAMYRSIPALAIAPSLPQNSPESLHIKFPCPQAFSVLETVKNLSYAMASGEEKILARRNLLPAL